MNSEDLSPEINDSSSRGVDPEILNAVLEMQEQGVVADLSSLASRFEGRDEEILAALEAVRSYQQQLARARRLRGRAQEGVLEPGTVLGDYTITGLLGQGAMGVVYRAQQGALEGREVALKVLPSSLVARDPRFLERFRREARLASTIHAPNIAEIYDFGSSEGQFFFAMRLVEGPSLADVLEELARRRRLGRVDHTQVAFVRQAAKLVRDVARALAVVHAAGLVHRDVKPSNLILERAPDADPADLAGVPTVVDFGLLRPVDASDLTGSMTVLGTPAFAAPEARLGRGVNARSDVYSLGVVLHDLLTLTRPIDRAPVSKGIGGVRAINPGVDARLAAVVEKAVEERPVLRYADGGEFASDLDRYLRGEGVRALPTRPWSRLFLWARRYPKRARRYALRACLTALLVAIVVFLGHWTITTYSVGSRALRQDNDGDLPGAADSYRSFRGKGGLASLLPGLSEVSERCDFYADPLLDTLCRRLQDDSAPPPDHAHEDLLRLLFSEDGRKYLELGFRFLSWELKPEQPMERRVKGARTCAQFFLVEPRKVLSTTYDSRSLEMGLDRLEENLVAAAREDLKEGPGLDLRRYAAGALTGLSLHSFDILLDLMSEDDLELKSIACAGADRIWYQLFDELHTKSPVDYGVIDQELLARWACTAWSAAHKHLQRTRRKNEKVSSQAREARKDKFVQQIGGDHLRWIALSRAHLKKAGCLIEWPGLNPQLEAHLSLLQGVYEEILEDRIPSKLDLNDPRLIRDLQGAELDEKEIFLWNIALLDPQGQSERMHRDNPHKYENTWTKKGSGKDGHLDSDSVDLSASQARLFFKDGQMRIDGSALGFEWTKASEQSAKPRPAFDGQGTVLRLATPGKSEVLFTAAIPEGTRSATVTLYHEVPSRAILPLMGRTKIGIDLCSGEFVCVQDLRATFDNLAITLPKLTLERHDDIQVKIRYLGSDAIYWLWRIVIDFEIPPPKGS